MHCTPSLRAQVCSDKLGPAVDIPHGRFPACGQSMAHMDAHVMLRVWRCGDSAAVPLRHDACVTLVPGCYTQKAPNTWHRRVTQQTGNTYNQMVPGCCCHCSTFRVYHTAHAGFPRVTLSMPAKLCHDDLSSHCGAPLRHHDPATTAVALWLIPGCTEEQTPVRSIVHCCTLRLNLAALASAITFNC